MSEIIFTIVIVGAALTDTLEAWVLALIGFVVVIDLIVGSRRKSFLVLGVVQLVGIVGGYFWASQMGQQQDVSGPYAWAFVVGLWCTSTTISHIVLVVIRSTMLRLRS